MILFCGSSLQQIGIQYTTAGNAGFITGFYVILVPILAIFGANRPGIKVWVGALFALIGMYLLSVTDRFTMEKGDLLILGSALFWALHITALGYFSRKIDGLFIAIVQFFCCGFLSLCVGIATEPLHFAQIQAAALPLAYGSFLTIGTAFTIQIFAQKHIPATHASIIMSMEAPIAAVGGILLLNEVLTQRGVIGCAIMFLGMLLAQLEKPTHIRSGRKKS